MAEPFATVEELVARLDWELDAKELTNAAAALEDASDLARGVGRASWEPATAPRLVRTTVLQAAKRYMQNPGGYTQSRAGDETLGWSDLGEKAGSVYFTEQEERLLKGLAGQASGLYIANTYAWQARPDKVQDIYVPAGGGDPVDDSLVYFAADDPAAPLDGGVTSESTYIDGVYTVDGEPVG